METENFRNWFNGYVLGAAVACVLCLVYDLAMPEDIAQPAVFHGMMLVVFTAIFVVRYILHQLDNR